MNLEVATGHPFSHITTQQSASRQTALSPQQRFALGWTSDKRIPQSDFNANALQPRFHRIGSRLRHLRSTKQIFSLKNITAFLGFYDHHNLYSSELNTFPGGLELNCFAKSRLKEVYAAYRRVLLHIKGIVPLHTLLSGE